MSFVNENVNELSSIPENIKWWEEFVKESFPNEKCIRYFKCSRKTYTYLIKFLKPHVAPRSTNAFDQDNNLYSRKGICIEKQVAILLFKLSHCPDYITISKRFQLHKTTIHKIIYKNLLAMNKYLLHSTINMPKEDEAQIIASDFEMAHKMPQVIGVMSVVHVPVASPLNLNYKFLNSKLYTSFVLQSTIDSNCVFRDISVRHPGGVEPEQIICDSNIFKYSHKVIPSSKRNIDGVDVSYKIVGPKNGPQYSWLLNDYNVELTSEESNFNEHLTEVRNYADSVVSRLRSRFLILSQTMDLNYKVVPQIIAACCIIHNLCEKFQDPFLEQWLHQCHDLLKKFPQPVSEPQWNEASQNTLLERDVIKDYVSRQDLFLS